MPATAWRPEYTTRAQELWVEYQQHHDVSKHTGDTAGIDPVSGRIWIGESAEDILAQLEGEGLETPLYFVRIGFDYYFRKGGHR